MNNQNESGNPQDDGPGILTQLTAGIVTDLATGATIPAPIRRNALKAFGRLFTAAIEIPAAYLEGKVAEKHAETQARVKLISTAAQQIAADMEVDPEYARVAVKKFGERVVREQINIDSVVKVAADQIRQDAKASAGSESGRSTETAEISDDWLNNFEKEASQKSTQEMQFLFGRILAGEIQQPSSFSIKTVKLVGELDNRVAKLFRTLCSLSITLKSGEHIFDARVASLGGAAGANALLSYGLGFEHLSLLHEFGLIIPDFNSYMDYRSPIANEKGEVGLPFHYQNKMWGLIASAEASKELRVHGVSFSKSGKELMKIVDTQPNDTYTEALKEYFNTLHFKMVPISLQVNRA
jgi:hypothetical protein